MVRHWSPGGQVSQTQNQPGPIITSGGRPPKLPYNHQAWLVGMPPEFAANMPEQIPTVVSIGGGKGGVGKSLLSANLAAQLGQLGFRVILVDLDLGSANLHTYFGVSVPAKNLAEMVIYRTCRLEDAITQTDIPGVFLLSSGRDEAWSNHMQLAQSKMPEIWQSLLATKQSLNIDFIIYDLGAGSHSHTVDIFISSHLGVTTVLPEPTSIENAYSFLKAGIGRMVDNMGKTWQEETNAEIFKNELFDTAQTSLRNSYVQRLNILKNTYPEFVDQLFFGMKGRSIGLVLNQIRSQKDIDVGHSMQTITRDYFGYQTQYLGYLNADDLAWKALRNRRLLLLDFPHSILAKRIHDVSKNLLIAVGYK